MKSFTLLTASEVADRIQRTPRQVTDVLYRRLVDTSECRLIGGMRLIPESLIPAIASAIAGVQERSRKRRKGTE